MKTTLILLGMFTVTMPLHAGWFVQPDTARIQYSSKQSEGYESFDEALKELSESGRIEKLDGIIAHELLPDDALQNELFAALERDAPQKLAVALKSSGNMHNQKMRQLWDSFAKALLATPTVTKLNASLAGYGLTVGRPEVEKFELRNTSTDSRRRFHDTLWLYVTKSPDHARGCVTSSVLL